MTTGRINQIAFVAALHSDGPSTRQCVGSPCFEPATRAEHRASAGSFCQVSASQRDYLFAVTFASPRATVAQGLDTIHAEAIRPAWARDRSLVQVD